MYKSSSPTSVKIHLDSTEIRRFECSDYPSFKSSLSRLCGVDLDQGMQVEYLDCEGDWIVLSTEEGFEEAVKFKKEDVLVMRMHKQKRKSVLRESEKRGKIQYLNDDNENHERKEWGNERRRRRGGSRFGRGRTGEYYKRREDLKIERMIHKCDKQILKVEKRFPKIETNNMPEDVKMKVIIKMNGRIKFLKEKKKMLKENPDLFFRLRREKREKRREIRDNRKDKTDENEMEKKNNYGDNNEGIFFVYENAEWKKRGRDRGRGRGRRRGRGRGRKYE